ncbi:hypothetical protein JQ506_22395 [Shinella sp. PSBB067]|uniref:hypothetical protein n=1 Tax=Shinella sp. PSBB067 TaxID=2715959 RepID=UPI00193B8A11|nr:hypothetical protein [Shinella sp. PSBB067]QRI63520.1 hypothetical protein JQ506_22395 [Shinella sp. PSBB067]
MRMMVPCPVAKDADRILPAQGDGIMICFNTPVQEMFIALERHAGPVAGCAR